MEQRKCPASGEAGALSACIAAAYMESALAAYRVFGAANHKAAAFLSFAFLYSALNLICETNPMFFRRSAT